MRRFRSFSAVGRAYFLLVIVLGLAIVPFGWLVHPPRLSDLPTLLYLAAATQLAALLPVNWRSGRQFQWTAPLVAAGLFAPGAGVALIAWLCLFDGRWPGRNVETWRFVHRSAAFALTYGLPSLLLAVVPNTPFWAIPVKSVLYGIAVVLLNYSIMGLAFSFIERRPVLQVLTNNVGRAGVQSVLVLAFAGGMIFVLLQQPTGVGYLLVPGLLGFLFIVRANVAYANKQREARLQTLELAAQTLDARDPYTESHSQRVAEVAVQLAERLNLGPARVEELRTAGHLHDLGKIGIPDRILNKPQPLTADEWELMRRHADVGADMLARHSEFAGIAPIVRAHHERWDGTGYPRGLRAEEIPLGARILSVADSFDTITEARLYRRSRMTPLEAVADISARSATWYDPAVVNALRSVHGLEPLAAPTPQADTSVRGFDLLARRPRFAWLMTGMTISSLGDAMTTVGSLVAIYAASRSPLAVAAAYLLKAAATVLMTGLFASLGDRLPRARIVVVADVVRGFLMLSTPIILTASVWLVFPVLFLLAVAGAFSQPARLAAIPSVVRDGEVGMAGALLQMGDMASKLIGYPAAGLVLWIGHNNVNPLFIVDGVTFVFAALTVSRIGSLGGGIAGTPAYGGLRRAWDVVPARAHLIVAAAAAFLLGMSLPTLIVYAYEIYPGGPQTYTLLEAALASGVIAGTVAVGRFANIGGLRTVAYGLAITGVLSLGFAAAPALVVAVALLFGASIGNPIYVVGNQTAMIEAAGDRTATLMSVRFGMTQGAIIAGGALAGALNAAGGPRWTYAILGLGLAVLAAGCAGALNRRRARVDDGPSDPPQDDSLALEAQPA